MISQQFFMPQNLGFVYSIGTFELRFFLQISKKMISAVLANLRLVGNSKGFNISEIELK